MEGVGNTPATAGVSNSRVQSPWTGGRGRVVNNQGVVIPKSVWSRWVMDYLDSGKPIELLAVEFVAWSKTYRP